MIKYPNINPNIISFNGIHLRWYGLAYALGFIAGYLYLNKKLKKLRIDGLMDDVLLYAVLGVIIGGRVGYVLIYNLPYYLKHPIEVLFIWRGGMSFHGGLVGTAVAGILLAKKYNISFYDIADEAVVIAPIGLFLGRIANFINDELWGRPSDLPWAVAFPTGGFIPRHPSQLYEAFFEGLVLFLILFFARDKLINKRGVLFWLFVLLYGFFRFFIEFTREPDPQLGFIFGLTMGQWLCLIMIAISIIELLKRWNYDKS
ncbi:prolipoprotein diacylglyceryl transferase [Hippea maritima]|uniref:Phosphatidylglycerol--prolipoprotein diacylglyceryl transferase n=1 Tax=Hippea maritima (strain ATCC 700847 / DSM 10411 / MH2) TaxID=760142 RepID=F2LW03_HIPMA|nr:prolipoprotein diacylglyceryl transferase [Hippea maritima]AEA33937.1 Prolipoprotein diacylglyceryl transferase [Hippea maritima DSM 10411]